MAEVGSLQDLGNSPQSRRSSAVYNSFQDILNLNGPNSINNFQSSYSRSTINFVNSELDVRPKQLSIGSAHRDSETSRLLHDSITSYAADEEVAETDDIESIFKGFSTVPQTIFNGINTLIGIGLFSLPMGLYYSGWIFGSLILLSCALSTQYAAKVLAKCVDKNPDLQTYGDIARYCFGNYVHAFVVLTFSIDLLSAGISMIIIFSDSFNAAFGIDKSLLKIIISIAFFISSFIRLDILSHLSLLGIISTSLIVSIMLITGLSFRGPGSLLQPAQTALWPIDNLHLFLSLGIFMSPFGGHAIFPELYKDMRHPKKYPSAIDITFRITWLVDYLVGGLGYLMFGEEIEDQVTKNVIRRSGWLVQLSFGVLLGILPITKGALITRPIVTMIDQFTITQQEKSKGIEPKKSEFTIKFINRFLVILVFGICSFVFTNFGLIMSFLGSAICFAICLINPLSFYLKLYYKEISKLEIGLTIAGIAISFVLAVCGTIAVAISGISGK